MDIKKLPPLKKFGQNFLKDSSVCEKIIAASQLSPDDIVIEIGSGRGILTRELAQKSKFVLAIEIDHGLVEYLRNNFCDSTNIEIIDGDFLRLELPKILKQKNITTAKVVANLPYYITTPIIMNLLENQPTVKSIVVMVQREFAERLKASSGSKIYGAISVAAQFYSEVEIVTFVSRNCFYPRPNVDSAVVKLTKTDFFRQKLEDEKIFFKLIKASFSMRRKTLVNCLVNQSWCKLSKEEITQLICKCGFDALIRGEDLSIDNFIRIANYMFELNLIPTHID